MCDLDLNYVAGDKVCDIVHRAFALRFTARQMRHRFSACGIDGHYFEAYGLAHACDDGYVLQLLAGPAPNSLLARYYALDPSEVKVEVHSAVAHQRALLKYRSCCHGAFKPRRRAEKQSVLGCVYEHSFGFVLSCHIRISFLHDQLIRSFAK